MGVLAGAGGPTAIAKWAVMKEDLLSRLLPMLRITVSKRPTSMVEAAYLSVSAALPPTT